MATVIGFLLTFATLVLVARNRNEFRRALNLVTSRNARDTVITDLDSIDDLADPVVSGLESDQTVTKRQLNNLAKAMVRIEANLDAVLSAEPMSFEAQGSDSWVSNEGKLWQARVQAKTGSPLESNKAHELVSAGERTRQAIQSYLRGDLGASDQIVSALASYTQAGAYVSTRLSHTQQADLSTGT